MNRTEDELQKLDEAAFDVDTALETDDAACSLPNLLQIRSPECDGASGFTTRDYPLSSGAPFNLDRMPQIKTINKMLLPQEILAYSRRAETRCMMGVFTEIGRAWLTVDNIIFFWDYETSLNVGCFNSLQSTILNVGLITPNREHFPNTAHLMVLTTCEEIIFSEISFEDGQLKVYPIIREPTDGFMITTITSSSEGRLFMGTEEGCLLELEYQRKCFWFGRRVKKYNRSANILSYFVPMFISSVFKKDGIKQTVIDNTRNILYVWTNKDAIEVFDLGANGKSFKKVIKLSRANFIAQALSTATILRDEKIFGSVISISVIEASESDHLHLMAVTENGVRVYMTTNANIHGPLTQRPYTLRVIHVRLPPSYSLHVRVQPPMVHLAHYNDRNLIFLSAGYGKDVLWCISPDLFSFNKRFVEAYTTINLDGHALVLGEIPQKNQAFNKDLKRLPVMVRQHSEQPRRFVVLTDTYAYILEQMRPIEILWQLLRQHKQLMDESIKTFFTVINPDQACATNLIIASLTRREDKEFSEAAAASFFSYGGEPRAATTDSITQTTFVSDSTSFYPYAISTPMGSSRSQWQRQNMVTLPYARTFTMNKNVIFSARRNGLYLYLSRILRPLWSKVCVQMDDTNGKYISSISRDECRTLWTYLAALDFFLKGRVITEINVDRNLQPPEIEERQSLDILKTFVVHCCEFMDLWALLCEQEFHDILRSLPPTCLNQLQQSTFKGLILYGQDTCKLLLAELSKRYTVNPPSVNSEYTQIRLTIQGEAVYSNVVEILGLACAEINSNEKGRLILQALDLCKSIAPNINLVQVCQEFMSARAYTAVIDLCMFCAEKMDPNRVAQNIFKKIALNPERERLARDFYDRRMEAYNELFNMLNTVWDEILPEVNSSGDGAVTQRREVPLLVMQLISETVQLGDEILQMALYDWMMRKEMYNELSQCNMPSVETYLKFVTAQNSENMVAQNILWQYYVNVNQLVKAATLLDRLASKSGTVIDLQERMAYLVTASGFLKRGNLAAAPDVGKLLHDVDEKLEVGRQQQSILEAIKNLEEPNPNAEDAITALNSGLYQLSQLFQQFAQPFELWECQLDIFDCGRYQDKALLHSIWNNILKKQLTPGALDRQSNVSRILVKVKRMAFQRGYARASFPLDFLIPELEMISTLFNADVDLVPNAFIGMNIPFEILLDEYHKLMLRMSEYALWRQHQNECRLLESIATLIEGFIITHDSYFINHKKKIASKCGDTVAHMLSILYIEYRATTLISRLRYIERQLQAL